MSGVRPEFTVIESIYRIRIQGCECLGMLGRDRLPM